MLAPTGTIAFMMDCDTTGIEPDIALVKYKKLVGGGLLKIVNQTVPVGAAQARLQRRPDRATSSTTSTRTRRSRARPELASEHLPVFDCAFKPANGERSIHYMGHVRMMAAVQPFIVGRDQQDGQHARGGHGRGDRAASTSRPGSSGLKAIAIYRDGCKRTQPLSTGKKKDKDQRPMRAQAADPSRRRRRRRSRLSSLESRKPHRRRLPDERRAITHKFDIAGHEGYITVGLYEDGQPGEIFLKMAKEGSTISGLMDTLRNDDLDRAAVRRAAAGPGQQVRHVRFEPAGFTGNPEIPIAKSIVDYIFRWLGSRFLSKDERDALGIINRDDAAAMAAAAEGTAIGLSAIPAADVDTTSPTTETSADSGEQADNSDIGGVGGPKAQAKAVEPPPTDSVSGTDLPVHSNGHANGHANGNGGAGSSLPIKPLDLGGGTKVAFSVSADSPSCADCGSIMVRNGSCYKCLNCGSTSGCS